MKSHCKTVIEPIWTLIKVQIEENTKILKDFKELIKNDKQQPNHI